MYPKLFGLFNTYGLMIGIGVLVCLWVFHKYGKKKGLEDKFIDFVEWLAIIAIIFGFTAAAIFQSFYNYIASPSSGFDNGLGSILGLALAVFFVLVIVAFQFIAKKINISADRKEFIDRVLVDLVAIGTIAPTIIIAVVSYIKNTADGLDFNGGITFIGGLIGGVVSFLIVYFWKRKQFKSKLIDMLSIAPCSITVAHGFGRLGCFFAGCCYGITSGTKFDMAFPIWSSDWEITGYVYHLPTQLYEAIFLFILFGIMTLLLLKKDFKYNMPVYLISYGIWRFLIEFIRDDDRGSFIGNISPSQFWSIVMLAIGVALIFLINYIYKNRKLELVDEPEKVEKED